MIETLVVASVMGVVCAVAAVLAIWLALGSGRAIWRAILAIAGASTVALAFCVISGEAEAEWLLFMWIVAAGVAAMFLIVRLRGFRLANAVTGKGRGPDELQFTVEQLLALTAVVAAVAAASRFLSPTTINALGLFLAIAACLGAVALVAVWATLRSDLTRIKTLTLLVVAVVMAGITYYGMEVTNADPGPIWGGTVIVYTAALAGSLLVVRWRGFRLLRSPERSQSPC